MSEHAKPTSLSVSIQVAKCVPAMVNTDVSRFKQILHHGLSNAVKVWAMACRVSRALASVLFTGTL